MRRPVSTASCCSWAPPRAPADGRRARTHPRPVGATLDRVQFGRPIAKFQAVQHNLAPLAGEVAAAGAAADGAAEAIAQCAGVDEAVSRGRDRQDPGRRGGRRPARRSRIRCTARWASPTSTRCTTRPGGCGPGARNSATRRFGRTGSATLVAAQGADALWPSCRRHMVRDREARWPQLHIRPGRPAARMQGIAAGGARLPRAGDRGRHLRPARRAQRWRHARSSAARSAPRAGSA